MISSEECLAEIGSLTVRKSVLIAYLKSKMDQGDWHGVQDAASDLRDLENRMAGLEHALGDSLA